MFKFLLLFSVIQIICGFPQPGNEITYAKQLDSPWTVWMKIGGDRRCTGSLINNEYILTAAHCFDSDGVEYEKLEDFIKIYIGDWKIGTDPDCRTDDSDSDDDSDEDEEPCSTHTVAEIPPEKLYIHEDYTSGHKLSDIALVKLMRPPRKFRYIKNIKLRAEDMEMENGSVTVTGFGEKQPKVFTKVKKITKVNLLEQKKCIKDMGKVFKEDYHFCGLSPNGITTCSGDSGGPVTSFVDGRHILEGIVGFGATECTRSNMPSLFLKVAPFADWIEQTMAGKIKRVTTTTTTTSTTPEPECEEEVCD